MVKILRHPLTFFASILVGFGLSYFDLSFPLLSRLSQLYLQIFGVIVIPLLIFLLSSSIPNLIAKKDGLKSLLRFIAAFFFIVIFTLVIIFLGYSVISSLSPLDENLRLELLKNNADVDLSLSLENEDVEQQTPFLGLLGQIVPPNIFKALEQNLLWPILFFAIIFGVVIGSLNKESNERLKGFLVSLRGAFEKIFSFLIIGLPLVLIFISADYFSNLSQVPFIVMVTLRMGWVLFLITVFFVFLSLIIIVRIPPDDRKSSLTYFFRGLFFASVNSDPLRTLPFLTGIFQPSHTRYRVLSPLALSLFNGGLFIFLLCFILLSGDIIQQSLSFVDFIFLVFQGVGMAFLFRLPSSAESGRLFSSISLTQGRSFSLSAPLYILLITIFRPLISMISFLFSFLFSCFSSLPFQRYVSNELNFEKIEVSVDNDLHEEDSLHSSKIFGAKESQNIHPEPEVVRNHREKGVLGIPFRISVVVLTIIMLLSYGLVSGLIQFTGNRLSLYGAGAILMKNNLDYINDRIDAYLSDTRGIAESTRYLIENDKINLTDISEMRDYFRDNVLATYSQVGSVYIGTSNGTFHMTKRMSDGSISYRTVQSDEGEIVSTWEHGNAEFEQDFPSRRYSLEEGYDPRSRVWYEKASRFGEGNWTNVYIFSSDKILGHTYAFPIFSSDGSRVEAVLGFDVGIVDFSFFLSNLDVRHRISGTIFLFDTQSLELIAVSDDDYRISSQLYRDNFLTEEFDPIRIPISESESDVLRSAYNALYGTGAERRGMGNAFTDVLFGNPLENNLEETGLDDEILQNVVFFQSGGEEYLAISDIIDVDPEFSWTLGVLAPSSSFLTIEKRNNIIQIILAAMIFLLVAVVGSYFARKISQPLVFLSRDMDRIGRMDIEQRPALHSSVREVVEIDRVLARMKQGLLSFRRYIPADLVQQLLDMNQAVEIGGDRKDITTFFSDIADFTQKSESQPPEMILDQLKTYFNVLSDNIIQKQGTIDKYVGDSVMAFWGAPQHIDNHARLACEAAINCQRALREMDNNDFTTTRIGIHSDRVLVGNVGSKHRINYTVLGDGVNLASRLEGLNKLYGTSIIVSGSTYEQVKDYIELRFLDKVSVKGRKDTTVIYQVLGIKGSEDYLIGDDADPQTVRRFLALYYEGSQLYQSFHWHEATQFFARAHRILPNDKAVQLLYSRSFDFSKNPPPEQWSGAIRIDSK